MTSLNEQLGVAVQKGDEKKVRSLCERLSKGRTEFNPTDSDVPPGNRVFLDRTYLRFSQKANREAVVHQARGQGWVITSPEDVLRALYGDTPVAQSPPEEVTEPETDPEEASPPGPEDPEDEDPLGEPEVTYHGPGDA